MKPGARARAHSNQAKPWQPRGRPGARGTTNGLSVSVRSGHWHSHGCVTTACSKNAPPTGQVDIEAERCKGDMTWAEQE